MEPLEQRALLSAGTSYDGAGVDLQAEQRLLIVAHDDFGGTLLDSYIDHKTDLGWNVDLVFTSAAGRTAPAIRDTIRARYDVAATRPNALLLVGDIDRLPAFVGQDSIVETTDLYYACMDPGDDWDPEFPVGRFSVTTIDQLSSVVAKTMAYENAYGTSSSADWTRRAAFLAGNDHYEISEATHDAVIDDHLEPWGYSSERLYAETYGATTQDVSDAVNEGLAMVVYSGHGSSYGWTDGPAFSQIQVRALSNAGQYPLVASFGCRAGQYNVGESLLETWLREENKGAVAAVGPSVDGYWTEDDLLERMLFDAIYDEGYVGFGAALNRAKELFQEHFGPTDTVRRYFEMYNLLGDPTLEVLGLKTTIFSPAELPVAFQGETYGVALRAGGGSGSYQWQLVDGNLPAGFSLDPSTGQIEGTPAAVGDARFTVEVTDDDANTDRREFHLPVTTRLTMPIAGVLPSTVADRPYLLTLQADGGTAPYNWAVIGAGPYGEDNRSPGFLGGGTPQDWKADDESWPLQLPWSFPFYGTDYDSVYVCTNGYLDFTSHATTYANSTAELQSNVRIAPLWDDLDTSAGNIYVTENEEYTAVRWDAVTRSGGYDVGIEAVLFRDGTIQFNYDGPHAGLTPTIGISNGNGEDYTLSEFDGDSTFLTAVSTRFVSEAPLPAGLTFDATIGRIDGAADQLGSFNLAVRVWDSGSTQQTVTKDLTLDVFSTIVGRHVFYNNSGFDGNLPAADQQDDDAIAVDKGPLLPGKKATFANYTSYLKGINGLMIDIAGLAPGYTPDVDDFEFRVGNSNNTAAWTDAPSPIAVTRRDNAGTDGSDRLTFIWEDGAVRNQWLEVTVPATSDIHLDGPDVFYFGNAVGEGGNTTEDARVNAIDMLMTRNNPRTFRDPAPIDFPYDYDRNTVVNAVDMQIVRNFQTAFLDALMLISPTEEPGEAPFAVSAGLSIDQFLWLQEYEPPSSAADALEREESTVLETIVDHP